LWKNPPSWTFEKNGSLTVAYCLSEVLPERCKLQLSLPLSIIVVFFNALKATCMLTMLFRLKEKLSDPPIMNLGDAVSSFLERSDAHTKKLGLRSMDDLRRAMNMAHRWDTRPKNGIGGSSSDSEATVSRLTMIMSLGFGKLDVRTMIQNHTKDLITNAMVVNSPQLVLSWVYFSYNGLLTLLALAREWESYALHRKGLRISGVPQGAQRSTYFLQLPYRIGLPFMAISAFLHWLVSQSFFLV
ncbi:hypothetical protein EK21DRAFT_27986, partial [Setomelanomma holmii]